MAHFDPPRSFERVLSFRDKDYVRTREGLLFNVIGYQHVPGAVTANLKYVDGAKWELGYSRARGFLSEHFSHYVDGDVVRVRETHVVEWFRPRDGLRRLLERPDPNRLEATTRALVETLAGFFELPGQVWGVTDSLLWGRGGDQSDIDLVVCGDEAAARVLSRCHQLYGQRRFTRLNAQNLSRRAAAADVDAGQRDWLAERRAHKGLFDGTRFSLRAVRDEDFAPPPEYNAIEPVSLLTRIVDNSESLFFPVVYSLETGRQLVSFDTQHEAIFRPGDLLQIQGVLERNKDGDEQLVVGGRGEGAQGIRCIA